MLSDQRLRKHWLCWRNGIRDLNHGKDKLKFLIFSLILEDWKVTKIKLRVFVDPESTRVKHNFEVINRFRDSDK